ncbi:helix-turn-helix domain-containing protein [Miltoncostaea marina]|uniref:helix-turn-helix domain-containing protein n=1 Tax=Miltoncostaea marina TaxID=2843215 RepID=UPI003CCE5830
MTVAEAAEHLGRSPAFVRSLIHSGAVPYAVHNRRLYVSRAALDDWLAGGAKPPSPTKARAPYVMPME